MEAGREKGRDAPAVPPWPEACLLLEESRAPATGDPNHHRHIRKEGREGGREGGRGETISRGGREGGKKGLRT